MTDAGRFLARALVGAWALLAPGATAAGESPAASPAAATPAAAETPKVEARLVFSQWHSLYLAGKKVGYTAQSLYELPGGARRLATSTFLRQSPAAEKFGYYKTITADVDAKFRPRALECRVGSGERQWQVKGEVQDREFVMKRTTEAGEATARVPLDEDVTFLSWALEATLLCGVRAGEARRWLVIDESLGALLPVQCLVRYVGPSGGGGATPAAVVMTALGPEQVAHLVEAGGRILRSIWQSAPLAAEATSLSDARRLSGVADGPRGVEVEGLETDHFHNQRLGLSLWLPPYPYVIHAATETGTVEIADLTDEANLTVQPIPRTGAGGPTLTEAEAARQLDLLQREWAARFDEVKTEPARPVDSPLAPAGASRSIDGTARLGCTTFYFRNTFLAGSGLSWLVSVTVADRPLSAKPALVQSAAGSIKASAPEGMLPMQVVGDVLRSPYYGFEVRRPSARWKIPAHVDGPVTVLELARDDRAAVAIVRMMKLRAGQTLEALAAEQAQLAAENVGAAKTEPKATTLAARKAVEIAYAGPKVLSGAPARCTAVYAPLGARVFALILVAGADADASAMKELQQIRESVRLSPPAAPKPTDEKGRP
jgi:hypothetical protein